MGKLVLTLVLSIQISVAQESNCDSLLIASIVTIESGGNRLAKKFEPHLIKKYGWPPEYAYSYGLMQIVYGFHHEFCKLTKIEDLFITRINLNCGYKILKNCAKTNKTLVDTLSCYNGDKTGKYASKVLGVLSEKQKKMVQRTNDGSESASRISGKFRSHSRTDCEFFKD